MRVHLILSILTLLFLVPSACTSPSAPERPSKQIRIVPMPTPAEAPRPARASRTPAPRPEPRMPSGDATLLADFEAGKSTLAQAPEDQAAFERGYLWTFAEDKAARNYAGAGTLLEKVLATHPQHPQTLRALGYVAVNQGFDVGRALDFYRRAVKSDESHGPSHYALAFLLGRSNPEQGGEHFERAMALGVPDARGLKARYYTAERKSK